MRRRNSPLGSPPRSTPGCAGLRSKRSVQESLGAFGAEKTSNKKGSVARSAEHRCGTVASSGCPRLQSGRSLRLKRMLLSNPGPKEDALGHGVVGDVHVQQPEGVRTHPESKGLSPLFRPKHLVEIFRGRPTIDSQEC